MTASSHPPHHRPAAAGSIPALPYEIWLAILRYFELRPLEFGRTRPDSGFTARRSVLWSLCLTSHRLLDIARPLLYANIVLPLDGSNPGARRCLRLLRTVSQNPRLGRLVVSLAVPLQLSFDARWWETSRSILAVNDVHGDHRQLFEKMHLLTEDAAVRGHQQAVQQKLVALLICLLPSLQRLLVHVPFTVDSSSRNLQAALRILLPDEDNNLIDSLNTLSITQRPPPTQTDAANEGGSTSHGKFEPLQRLDVLQLQQGPSLDGPVLLPEDSGDGNGLEGILPILKLRAGKLKRLDLSDHCLQDVNTNDTATSVIAQITELNLVHLDHPGEATLLLRSARKLETLSLNLTRHAVPPSPSTSAGTNDDYNMAILERRDTLRSLSFTAADFDPVELGYLLGPLGRLTCLSQLSHLRFLRVEPHLLIDWLEVNTWPKFLDNLPKSLLKLAFRFQPRHEELCHIWARSGIGAALASGERWRRKLPQLEAICLEPLPYIPRVAEELAESLKMDGITLTWMHEI
ncbi:uncharacterized protein B0I36DRAFT_358779 [Microdochium trichocladiopsis]|uniref:F-box domain-containing protein n=1 Tax=Microdochium trichocladiopsis TaxID=1682393 RepID=A0A9P8YDS9_9PEZI|nr:uncharacterized protein B0I36DRAFT_358779 [Microdochium trichocladiopsis]KAH7037027.1 hypothetical protein B0I36DRAFT_358779 [Microdochium trichocladiopsis]